MNHDETILTEVANLLILSREGSLNDEQFESLRALLRDNRAARQCYYSLVNLEVALQESADLSESPDGPPDELIDMPLWNVLRQHEQQAPAIAIEKAPPPAPRPARRPDPADSSRQINKFSLFVAIASSAALVFFLLLVNLLPDRTGVEAASLAESVHAKWADSSPLEPGSRLSTGRNFLLREGYAKLLFDSRAQVTVEAPAEFEILTDDQIRLNYGRVYAIVPDEAHGFTVSARDLKIIDLGTEFGVYSDLYGNTELHVIKGRTSLISTLPDHTVNLEVHAGAARRLFNATGEVQDIALETGRFVRSIDTQNRFVWKGQAVSLADIVGGGNGFEGGTANMGIDVTTGGTRRSLSNIDTQIGSAGFRPVQSSPYIDGVFIPGAGEGPTVITADGSCRAAFPETGATFWGTIFNGAFHEGTTTPRHSLRLGGEAYGTPENPAITIHSSQGITFDLAAIRKGVPGLAIRKFRALAGVSETVRDELRREEGGAFEEFPEVKQIVDAGFSKSEFWVLVDGREAFGRVLSSADEAAEVEIALTEQDRFLTLAVTEADDSQAFDWALFGRPELVLEATER